ncbi:PorP/SprF family type IX secretion system membrane protein [Terrimonas ferruginea]|uniref:PorP/SprF family type IX secretion system membrane protein n=1 Tax=Terrimonas ferruginea TaxID=249 RepID=UPI00048D3E7D|nr:type IX secretion system membrane protein PorP/SprF [Terrimonas ferruginea]
MKKLLILGSCVLIAFTARAQQKPHYTQYILNQYIVNPALTGIENYTDIKLSHRHQWTGIQDAPVTSYLTIHGPIGKKDYRTTATSFEVPGENPRGKQYWQDYTSAEPHHGVGLQVINDVTGPLSNFSAYGTYAYHIGLTPRTSLSGGFGAGISRISLDAEKLDFGSTVVDPAVYAQNGVLNKTRFDMMAGLYLYSPDYFIGLSAQQIVPSKIDFSNNAIRPKEGKSVPHIFATAGYRFLVGYDFNLIPSVMVKYINPMPTQIEANVKLQYQDFLWVGAGYRYKDGFNGMLGVNVSNTVNVGYAYDYTTSRLNNFSKGTHEIILGFLLNNKYDDSCPRNVW